jgi:hypothetical protein
LEMIFELHLLETLDLLFERKKKLPFEWAYGKERIWGKEKCLTRPISK